MSAKVDVGVRRRRFVVVLIVGVLFVAAVGFALTDLAIPT